MTQTVNNYQVGTFTTPVNGGPQDASVVLANDNTTRSAHNSHDSDPGVHLQSSLAASLPAAGTVGRKWLTTDTLRLFYDTGSAWAEAAYLPTAGGTLTGDLTGTRITLHDNLLYESFTNGNANLAMNFVGYAGGTTQYRDFTVYDGKNSSILSVVGATKAASFAGALTATGIITTTAQIVAPTVGTNSGGVPLVLANGATTVGTFSASLATLPFGLTVTGQTTLSAALQHNGTTAGFFSTTARVKAGLNYPTTYTLGSFEGAVLAILTNYGLLTVTQSGTNWIVS
jgi:hypothetical protein